MPDSKLASRVSTGYLPSLDGWRAVAILLVILSHDADWVFRGHTNADWKEYGGWGVFLFFGISGLLITTRILVDEARFGTFHIGRFYVRRFFRIQPPAFVYLGVIALLTAVHIAHERWASILGALFLYTNYLYDPKNLSGNWRLTGHFWTLAVEEHFYLLLSLLMFFFKRWRIPVMTALLLFLVAFQIWAIQQGWATDARLRHTEYVLPYLIAPALYALLLRHRKFRAGVEKWLLPWVAFSGTILLKALWFLCYPIPRKYVSLTMLAIQPYWLLWYGFGFWVLATMLHPRSWTTRVLELRPLRFIGRLSYSLYLWHVLFIVGRLPVVGLPAWTAPLTGRPGRYIATFVMALLSYYVVERPLMRLGHRLAPPATPGHRDLEVGSEPDVLQALAPQ